MILSLLETPYLDSGLDINLHFKHIKTLHAEDYGTLIPLVYHSVFMSYKQPRFLV